MAFPRMVRVRQTFPRPRVSDIPRAVAEALDRAGLPVSKRPDLTPLGDPAPLPFDATGRLVPLTSPR